MRAKPAPKRHEIKKTAAAHSHSYSMALYALDAAETPEPWKRWEVYTGCIGVPAGWVRLNGNPEWNPDYKYRRIRRKGLVNGVEVYDGVTVKPEPQQCFYVPDPTSAEKEDLTDSEYWDEEDDMHQHWLASGLVYLDQQEAHDRAVAMLRIELT